MADWTADTKYACGWGFDESCIPCADKVTGEDRIAIFQNAVNVAAEILYALSGRQFGLCELTIRPCRLDECGPCGGGPRWTPALVGGNWVNVTCGRCGDGCSCSKVCDLRLPGPVETIVEVKQDGVPLALDDFRVDHRRTLVRKGDECWPSCQDMEADDTEPGTYSITYLRGKPLPEAGKRALALLACELFLDCINDDCCALPKRIKEISRQGVSYAMLDPMDFIPNGKTGLYTVDLWLHSVNPQAARRSSAILSPDMPRNRRETWPNNQVNPYYGGGY